MSIHALSASSLTAAPSCAGKVRHGERREESRPTEEVARRGPGALRGTLDAVVSELAGPDAVHSEASADALHDFTGALFDALRSEGGREVGHGPGRHVQRGHAWGRQGGDDLAQRIEALAAKLGTAPAPDAAAATPATPEAPVTAPTDAVPVTDASAAPAPAATAVPAAPSEFETRFAALWQSLQPAGSTAGGADLVGFLHTLAQRLGAAAAPALPVGSLVDTTA